ncbi:NADH dehydrogenase subunit L [Halapricum desulfuricans]|uniref:NADH dehydrogenase subunit L n=1 Tax=Halapricum desulfuricans TaxID=2841257 RepID=A0A897N4K5_9EURY|nr:NADH dehydrogenase subunit L [Halapricum desulfuricans]
MTNVTFPIGIPTLIGISGFSGFWTKEVIPASRPHGDPIELDSRRDRLLRLDSFI